MTKVAIWCRHAKDNIIGSDGNIPWHIPSDMRRFRNLTKNKTLVMGRKTYESLPNRTLPNRHLLVLTNNENYELSDKQNHEVITEVDCLKDYPQDLFISGGAKVYDLFFTTPYLMPDVVVDCVYQGEINSQITNNANIDTSISVLEKKYFPLPQKFELDEVITTVWLKKGDFVEQSVVKEILRYLENEGV